jgi:ATP-dependent Lon protease
LPDRDEMEERFVGVPEEGGRDLIAADPLAPGSVYAVSLSDEGKVGLYRLEVGVSAGTGKLRVAGGVDTTMRESFQRAFAYLHGHKKDFGIGQMLDTTDFHVEAIDLLSNRVASEVGVAFFVAIFSALQKRASLPASSSSATCPSRATSSPSGAWSSPCAW